MASSTPAAGPLTSMATAGVAVGHGATAGVGGIHVTAQHTAGSTLDGYNLGRLLGRCGFGEVWLCRSGAVGGFHALKFISASYPSFRHLYPQPIRLQPLLYELPRLRANLAVAGGLEFGNPPVPVGLPPDAKSGAARVQHPVDVALAGLHARRVAGDAVLLLPPFGDEFCLVAERNDPAFDARQWRERQRAVLFAERPEFLSMASVLAFLRLLGWE